MKLTKIRTTALSLYENCPYCFLLATQGVRQPHKEAFEFGTRVHKAIEQYVSAPKWRFDSDIRAYVDLFSGMYDREKVIHSEWKFELPLFDTGVTLTGTADMIYDNWLLEHKTSSARYTQEEVDTHRQVTAYSWAFETLSKQKLDGIRFNVFIKNKTPLLQCVDTYRTQEDYDEWKVWVYDILAKIDRNEFDPKPSRWHIYSICPMNL
jgi:hypothetical protein